MTFWRTVGAYLTGWLIVMPAYNRLWAAWRRREFANPGPELRKARQDEAVAIVDELERRVVFTDREVRHAVVIAHVQGWRQCKAGQPAPSPDELMDQVLAMMQEVPNG